MKVRPPGGTGGARTGYAADAFQIEIDGEMQTVGGEVSDANSPLSATELGISEDAQAALQALLERISRKTPDDAMRGENSAYTLNGIVTWLQGDQFEDLSEVEYIRRIEETPLAAPFDGPLERAQIASAVQSQPEPMPQQQRLPPADQGDQGRGHSRRDPRPLPER